MKVLVTGASGHVATMAMPGIQDRCDLVLADIQRPADVPANATFHEINILEASDEEFANLFDGVDVVIHSAYIHSGQNDVYSYEPPQIDRFEPELNNVRMAQRVYRCALESCVRRVIMVSSNHAADWYEHNQIHQRSRDMIYPTDYPFTDNFYGWAKASYELLAYPYACGTFGRRLEMIHIRIGSPYPIDVSRFEPDAEVAKLSLNKPSGLAGFKRALGTYLSQRDCAELFRAALEAEHIVSEGEVPWVIVYGISDNTRAFWSLETARRQLGYVPQDDAEIIYADDIRRLLVDGGASGRSGLTGG